MHVFSLWRRGVPILPALLLLMGVSEARGGQRGLLTAIGVSPETTRIGTAVTATVTGRNPCGAVFIDWADGTALTYPLHELPATQTHTYQKAGHYTVVARGMGNCDGETTARVRIDPPPAPPERPQLTSLAMSSPAVVGTPVTMTAHGRGTCRFTVEFGDGNSQEFTTNLPHSFRHVYAVVRSYTVVASAAPPCEGRHSARLEITRAGPGARLTGLDVAPNPTAAPAEVTITLTGSGKCTYLLDYGDGNSERLSGSLPDRWRHVYNAPNTYTVKATGEAPCEGTVDHTLTVRGADTRVLTRLVVSPTPTTVRTRVTITIDGRGTCPVTIDFGDGSDQSIETALPARITHTYLRADLYEIYAWADPPCTGEATASVDVRRVRIPYP